VTQVTAELPGQPSDPDQPQPGDLPERQRPGEMTDEVATRRGILPMTRSLVALTKPRIIELLLVTTLPAMFLAERAVPPARLIAVTLLGGAMAAGSANAINCVIDRDIDAVMRRTARRPLVKTGSRRPAVLPAEAVAFAVALGIGATVLLGLGANWLAAGLADLAIAFYVVVYTLWLKRRSASNIVIGGAAGCLPVLVGWASVTGRVAWPALVLFAVVFFWTPPHFWALAMKFRDDYAAAGVPMLPVVAGPSVVARKIVGYSWIMVATSLALTWWAGWLYGACAIVLGAWFLREAHDLRRRVAAGGATGSMRLFHQSILYLSLLFGAVAVTALLPWGSV
jgi:heme o synthase